MAKNLYKETFDFIALQGLMMDLVDEETGEILEIEEYEKLEDEVNHRITNNLDEIMADIRKQDTMVSVVDDEIKRLQDRKKILSKRSEGALTRVKNFMLSTNQKKLETALGEFKTTRSEAVVFTDELKIPDEYKEEVVKTTIKINKANLKKLIKSGTNVEGVTLEVRTNIKLK